MKVSESGGLEWPKLTIGPLKHLRHHYTYGA